jgi:hypothetical protein
MDPLTKRDWPIVLLACLLNPELVTVALMFSGLFVCAGLYERLRYGKPLRRSWRDLWHSEHTPPPPPPHEHKWWTEVAYQTVVGDWLFVEWCMTCPARRKRRQPCAPSLL